VKQNPLQILIRLQESFMQNNFFNKMYRGKNNITQKWNNTRSLRKPVTGHSVSSPAPELCNDFPKILQSDTNRSITEKKKLKGHSQSSAPSRWYGR